MRFVKKKGNDCQTKKFYMLNEFSLSEPKQMYKEGYGEYGF